MKVIRDMSTAEFYVFMMGGQRMLRENAMSWARTAKGRGENPTVYVAQARSYHRSSRQYLREYRRAKRHEALTTIQRALEQARREPSLVG